VHNVHVVGVLHHHQYGAHQVGRVLLIVVALSRDVLKQLPACAELHDYVHVAGILVGAFESDDVGVAAKVVHDLDLAAHVLRILRVDQPLDVMGLWFGGGGTVAQRGS
jgi:hypothetical protein